MESSSTPRVQALLKVLRDAEEEQELLVAVPTDAFKRKNAQIRDIVEEIRVNRKFKDVTIIEVRGTKHYLEKIKEKLNKALL